MRVRLYLDQDASSRSLTRSLRSRGIDVLNAVEAERLDRDDLTNLNSLRKRPCALYLQRGSLLSTPF